MASTNAVWGIEVGQCALKAVRLRPTGGDQFELVAFDLIEHPKLLSQPDADTDELIRAALDKFAERNEWQGDKFVIGVPGQQTFSRFTKLPPVEAKKIPEIVRFEASQQIPFDIEDVVWDYQVFQDEDSPDIEVGIFAMRRDLVRRQLDFYGSIKITPSMVQTIPSALYNFCRFDQAADLAEGQATVIVDVGAQNTDLIIIEPNSAWMRNIPLGGNNFTEALIKAFKLSFAKAENLKRTAATSKYARQIFQSMRPVFAELVAEIQRSLGFYSQTHRDVSIRNVLACGNAFRLPGLQKYLENNLSVDGGVAKLEKFNHINASQTANAPQFTENIMSFAAAYGLALQGLGVTKIESNLLPPELARVAAWRKKQPIFAAAAAALLVGAFIPQARSTMDKNALETEASKSAGAEAKRIISTAAEFSKEFNQVATDTTAKEENIKKIFELQDKRGLIPRIMTMVTESLPVDPDVAAIKTPEEMKALAKSKPRNDRKQFYLDSVDIEFHKGIDGFVRQDESPQGNSMGGGFSGPSGRGGGSDDTSATGDPGFYVQIRGRLTYGARASDVTSVIENEYFPALREYAKQKGLGFYMPDEDEKAPALAKGKNLAALTVTPVSVDPSQASGGGRGMMLSGGPSPDMNAEVTDPVTGEPIKTDHRFSFGFKLKLGEDPNAGKEEADKAPGQG
ncbi:MAG: type IV pilus assembly protein PilM [Phycisphaerales bacterium]|nr:type IV pilus assembly protein PilM [Phycisphaerales bacterium]